MKNILITNNSPENLNDVFQLLNNAQKYGNNFKFISLNFESNKNNNDSIPDEYIDLIKIFSKYCYELNLNILKIKNLIIRLHQIYEEFKPDIVVVWSNKVDSTGGVLYEFSKIKKLKIFFSENTPIPGTFYIEKKTRFEFIKELSSIKNTVNKNKYEYLVKRGRKIVNKILHELPTRHQFNNKKNYDRIFTSKKNKVLILGSDLIGHALLPLNHPYKKYTFPLFKNYAEMINYLSQKKDVDIWFKPHLARGFEKYYSEIPKKENIFYFDYDVDPNILIKNSDLVITSLTKLEINAFALGKPIIYAGIGWFWSQGFSKDCVTKEDLLFSIDEVFKKKPNKFQINNTMAIIAWTEDSYINLYDYASKKDLTSNFTQIKKLYDLLEINKDLACCSGVTLAYNYDKNKKEVNGFYLYTYPPFNECKKLNLMQNNPFERLKYHMENYIPIATYNVTRSEYFKKIVNLIGLKEYKAYASWEIQFEIAMSLFGKIKFIPVIYWIRGWEVSAIRNTSPSMTILNSADDWWNNEMNKNEKDQFSKDLLNLIFSESKDFNKSKINFINIMNKYFEKKIKKNKKKVVFSFSFFRIFKVFVPSFLLDKITNRSLVGKIKNLKKYNLSVDEKEVNEIVRLIKKNPINEF